MLPHGRAQRHNVAKNLAMSPRTLARRLASEGTTFEEVVDELRRSLALQYIKTPSVSLSQVAWLVVAAIALSGFSMSPKAATRSRHTALECGAPASMNQY